MGLFGTTIRVSKVRLDGKTAIVTGGNGGLGFETVKDFYGRGARVIMASRSLDKANAAVDEIEKSFASGRETLGQIRVSKLDLGSLTSVRQFAHDILANEQRIDILVNNAGIMMVPEGKTEDGFELQFGTNHLGHFLLTLLLLPKIIKSAPARIVNLSSIGHTSGKIHFDDFHYEKRKYGGLDAYGQSKLANVLFTKELARQLEERNISGVTTYSLHPGIIATGLLKDVDKAYFPGTRLFFRISGYCFEKTPEEGAQTQIYCAVDERCANETGLYYSDCAVKEPSKRAKKVEDAKRLWIESLKMVGLGEDYDPFV